MKTAYINLIKYSLRCGNSISVYDGEVCSTIKSRKYKEIISDIKGVEEAHILIYDTEKRLGWALVSAYGLDADETVIDHTDNDYMNNWWKQYEKLV